MDVWKFYDITHREHVLCNPTSGEKLGRLIDLLRLPRGTRVVDIACGKAEFLVRLAESYGVRGLGVDISPFFAGEAERVVEERVPEADISVKLMNGADFRPDEPHSFGLSSCIGASWIFAGHEGTLDALIAMTEPEYFCQTDVLGPLSPAGVPETADYDEKVRQQFLE